MISNLLILCNHKRNVKLIVNQKNSRICMAVFTLYQSLKSSFVNLARGGLFWEFLGEGRKQIFYIYHFRLSRNELRSLEIVRALYCGCNTHS